MADGAPCKQRSRAATSANATKFTSSQYVGRLPDGDGKTRPAGAADTHLCVLTHSRPLFRREQFPGPPPKPGVTRTPPVALCVQPVAAVPHGHSTIDGLRWFDEMAYSCSSADPSLGVYADGNFVEPDRVSRQMLPPCLPPMCGQCRTSLAPALRQHLPGITVECLATQTMVEGSGTAQCRCRRLSTRLPCLGRTC